MQCRLSTTRSFHCLLSCITYSPDLREAYPPRQYKRYLKNDYAPAEDLPADAAEAVMAELDTELEDGYHPQVLLSKTVLRISSKAANMHQTQLYFRAEISFARMSSTGLTTDIVY